MKTSGYTTTWNCIEMQYPFEQCINSMLEFCDEVCIADAGSADGTAERLKEMSQADSRIHVRNVAVDFKHPRWALYVDGFLKSHALDMCTGDVLWQLDTDQIISEHHIPDAKLASRMVYERKIVLALAQIEFWGSMDIVRGDLQHKSMIHPASLGLTHGIKKGARCYDEMGHVYCQPYHSDSCDLIDLNKEVVHPYSTPVAPPVYHVSWLHFERKIQHYRHFWHKFHESMYNLLPGVNGMFDKPVQEATDEDVIHLMAKMYEYGPRSFHNYQEHWRGAAFEILPSFKQAIPSGIKEWLDSTSATLTPRAVLESLGIDSHMP